MKPGRSTTSIVLIGLLCVVFTVIVSVSVGSVSVSISDSFRVLASHLLPIDVDVSPLADAIVWNIRMPRAIVALLTGAVLGVTGTVLQGSLKNPIADAQLVGLSSAAAVGALLGFWLGYASGGPTVAVAAGAVSGLLGALAVRWLAGKVGGEPSRFILVGIGAGLGLGALVATASIAIHDPRIPDVTFWFFGGLGAATWGVAGALAIAAMLTLGGIMPLARKLDVLSLGHEPARHVGVNVATTLAVVLALVGLGTGASVGAAGVVGFVGLVGGRVASRMVGPHHKHVIPASAFIGAVFVIGADVVGRIAGLGFEVPVGLITTVLGGAYLVWLIARNKVPV
ncbi:MAG: iron ABC transporter permease [Armatimonadetes bacterium]|nr:MAG: iron ABC transporter permease [Armatimonadota bacterium]